MGNTFVNASAVSREFLRVLRSNTPFINSIDRQYNNDVKAGSVKHGGTIAIRKPTEFAVRSGAVANVQNITATSQNLTVATQEGIDCVISSQQMKLNLDDLSKEVISPAAARLAARLESAAMVGMYKKVWQSVGTPGTAPATALVWLQAAGKLDASLAPRDGQRTAILTPQGQAATVAGLSALFNPNSKIGKQYNDGTMGEALGLNFKLGQLAPTHTCGSRDNTTPLVKGAGQTGDSLIIDGDSGNNTITAGDVFTIAGVYAVNQDKQSTGELMQFTVVTATAFGASDVTLTISPAIVTSGATQNVSAGPGNDAAITWVGSASTAYPQNLVFHKDAFTLATVDLDIPSGLHYASREVLDGVSLRVLGDYDIINDRYIMRFDLLYGFLAQRPELAVRVWG